jgi:molybdopterin adenylyltransferase
MAAKPYRVGVLTISDRGAAGEYVDQSGPAIRYLITQALASTIAESALVSDDFDRIRDRLIQWVDEQKLDLILTSGGTGFAPRDVTPEATRSVIQRETPGLSLAMIQAGLAVTPHAMLSRPVTGIRGNCLIVNLPGSPKAATENLQTILPALPHALELLRDTSGGEDGHEYRQR